MAEVATGPDEAWRSREAAQAAAFDGMGERYDAAFPHKEGQVACAAELLARLPAGARVLDLGCGTGLPTARQLVDAGVEVTGVDYAPVMLAAARANVPEARFRQADMVDLARTGDRFDAVVAFFSLLTLPRARMGAMLGLIGELLVPGGRLALGSVEADLDDVPVPFLGRDLRVTGYPRDALRAVLADAGFAVEWERALSYTPAMPEAPPETQLFHLCRRAEPTA